MILPVCGFWSYSHSHNAPLNARPCTMLCRWSDRHGHSPAAASLPPSQADGASETTDSLQNTGYSMPSSTHSSMHSLPDTPRAGTGSAAGQQGSTAGQPFVSEQGPVQHSTVSRHSTPLESACSAAAPSTTQKKPASPGAAPFTTQKEQAEAEATAPNGPGSKQSKGKLAFLPFSDGLKSCLGQVGAGVGGERGAALLRVLAFFASCTFLELSFAWPAHYT